MLQPKAKSRKLIVAQTAYTRAQTGWLGILVIGVLLAAFVLFAPFVAILMLFGSTALGLVLLVLAAVALTIFCIWLGSRMNDKSQENFIAMIGHLKSALTVSVREETRTWGAYERAQIDLEKKVVQNQFKQHSPTPSADELQREAWAAQFMGGTSQPIETEWRAVDDDDSNDYVMDDIV